MPGCCSALFPPRFRSARRSGRPQQAQATAPRVGHHAPRPRKLPHSINYWLVKSEPSKYSWDQFVAEGHAVWDGVRNYAARNNLKAMKAGDRVFFYHSNEGLAIVGI